MTVAVNRLCRVVVWVRRPWDRCEFGGHTMRTKSGYRRCRKHFGWISEEGIPK